MGKMRQFRREIKGCVGKPLLFHARDGYGAVLYGLFERVGRGDRVHDADIHEMMADSRAEHDDDGEPRRIAISAGPQLIPGGPGAKATALVPVRGVAMYDLDYPPYCFSTLLLAQTVTQLANDPEIGMIVLDIDSPGGMVTGTAEAGDAIFAARKRKKVMALVNPLAASAAYWLASQATEIIAIKSADIGSIGVFMVHTDCSKFNEMQGMKVTYIFAGEHKVEGNPDEPLADDARAYYQSEVDTIYQQFLKAVARGRGVSVTEVFDNYGKGRCMMAPAAKDAGLIDDFMTIGDAMSRWGVSMMPAQQDARRRGEDESPEPAAAVESVDRPDRSAEMAALMEGCETVVFRRVQDDEGQKVYVESNWPRKMVVAPDLPSPGGTTVFVVVNDRVSFNLANGSAVYHKLGETLSGDWVCELVEGTFEPPPSQAAITEQAQAAAAREAEIDAAFMRASARR